jgi:hypothetical protein
LKTAELRQTAIPRYEELSVKNLYKDAMSDVEVCQYLPDLEQNSSKLPEREFFFNVLGTVKPEYLKYIIEQTEQYRFKGSDENSRSNIIMMTDKWLQELNNTPSSQVSSGS